MTIQSPTIKKAPAEEMLAQEYETYTTHLPQLGHLQGKFALVHQATLVGVFDTCKDALLAGYEKFGHATPFFVKRISLVESPVIFR